MSVIGQALSIALDPVLLGFGDGGHPSLWIVAAAGIAIGLIARFRRDD